MPETANSPAHPGSPHPPDTAAQAIADLTLTLLALQLIDQIDCIEEPHPFALVNGRDPNGGGQMEFARSRAAHQNQVVRGFHKGRTGQLLDNRLRQLGFRPPA